MKRNTNLLLGTFLLLMSGSLASAAEAQTSTRWRPVEPQFQHRNVQVLRQQRQQTLSPEPTHDVPEIGNTGLGGVVLILTGSYLYLMDRRHRT